jgi:predicted transcriptional regulator of viral defense system
VNLNDAREILRHTGMEIFTFRDMSRLMGTDPPVTRVYIHRMKEKGFLIPVQRGIYSITEDPFIIASQIDQPAYLSFSSALYLYGRYSQVVNDLFVATSGKTRQVSMEGYNIHFVHFEGPMMYGYRKDPKGNSYITLADLEKAVIDTLAKPRYMPIADCFSALQEGFDEKLLEEYAITSGSEPVIRRAGFLLETLGKDTALSPSTATVYTLNPAIKRKGSFNAKWKLYVNEVF